jgi:hypothetical protein
VGVLASEIDEAQNGVGASAGSAGSQIDEAITDAVGRDAAVGRRRWRRRPGGVL